MGEISRCLRFRASSQKGQPAQWPTFQQNEFVRKESHATSFHSSPSSFFFLGKVKGSLRWRGTFANYAADRRITGRHGVVRAGGEKKSKSGGGDRDCTSESLFFFFTCRILYSCKHQLGEKPQWEGT